MIRGNSSHFEYFIILFLSKGHISKPRRYMYHPTSRAKQSYCTQLKLDLSCLMYTHVNHYLPWPRRRFCLVWLYERVLWSRRRWKRWDSSKFLCLVGACGNDESRCREQPRIPLSCRLFGERGILRCVKYNFCY